MASNLNYVDKKPANRLSAGTLNLIAVKSTMLQASFNYERMQACGWLWTILPGLEKIHTNKEDLATSMTHNMEFFNTHPFLVTFVAGVVLSLEQEKADVNTIRAVRTAAMGPLGGIGDALFWFTLVPITAGITAQMAIEGSWVGPIVYFIITFGVQMALRIWLMHWSYSLGSKAIGVLTKNAKEFTHAASMLGVFVVGALTCNYGGTSLGMVFSNGEQPVVLQDKLNGILPAMIPLALTLMCYALIKKRKWTPVKCILLLLFIGIVGCMFHIWAAGDYNGIMNVPWHTWVEIK